MTPALKAPGGGPAKVDYSIPNFGMDFDIKDSLAHTAELEKVHGKWTPTKKGDGDAPYTVPNFGLDKDMLDASESISATQAQLGHTWEPTQDKNGVWQVPQPIDNRSYSYSG